MNCKDLEIIFTVIPPPLEWDISKVERKAFEVANITKVLDINFISLPEVVEERSRGHRIIPFKMKIDNVVFGEMIKSFDRDLEIIVNKISVIMDKQEFESWIEQNSKKFNYLLIVGGESSKIRYEGYYPIPATIIARNHFKNIYGITIFHRRDEAKRLLEKTKAGMKAFVSQIVFELESAKFVINEYIKLCREENIEPSKIFISFAPVSQLKDVEFLKWLGVYIPKDIESFILEDEKKLEKRSIEIIESLFHELCFLNINNLGVNIEHVMYNNLQVAAYTVHRIKEIWRWR
ncbi:MAG: methylenetetrahydrofolate reductase [candidate division WOR-3 bacterium]|nr:methylenetetrahydrofolate reductase [candidate division WOR-3 bacterium]